MKSPLCRANASDSCHDAPSNDALFVRLLDVRRGNQSHREEKYRRIDPKQFHINSFK